MTCFHVAVRHGHTDLIQVLLKTGQIDINDQVRKSCQACLFLFSFLSSVVMYVTSFVSLNCAPDQRVFCRHMQGRVLSGQCK